MPRASDVHPRKKKPRQDVNWPFRLVVLFVAVAALGWTGYHYGVKPYRARQLAELEQRKAELSASFQKELDALRAEQEAELGNLEMQLKVLDLDHQEYVEKLRRLEAGDSAAAPAEAPVLEGP